MSARHVSHSTGLAHSKRKVMPVGSHLIDGYDSNIARHEHVVDVHFCLMVGVGVREIEIDLFKGNISSHRGMGINAGIRDFF